MIKKNDEAVLEICDVTGEGFGVGKYTDADTKDFVTYVPFTAIGDRIRCKFLKVLSSYAFGKAEELIAPSADRTENDCAVFGKCGGCAYRHVSYGAELKYKKSAVEQAYRRVFGKDGFPKVADTVASPRTEGYRNKVEYPIGKDGACGFYMKKSHRSVRVENCALQHPAFERIVEEFEKFVAEYSLIPYDEESGKGLLRHLYLRVGEATGEICVCAVINAKKLPHEDEFIKRLSALEGVKSIYINSNCKNTNVILSDDYRLLWGDEYIRDKMCGLFVRISPQSFYQVNRAQAERIYSDALSLAEKGGNLLDLYCGIGLIGLSGARDFKKVVGVEIVPEAIEDAKAIAKANGIENAEFYTSDAKRLSALLGQIGFTPDAVIVDPPRKGLGEETVKALLALGVNKIVYVSCNPSTQAADARALCAGGYRLESITPYDMFPRTHHVESVVCLSREKTVHEMNLNPSPFEKIKSGQKTIELRLYDEKRQRIKEGDVIAFTNTSSGEKMRATVKTLHRFDSFEELYKTLPLLQCGYTAEDIDTAHPSDMEQYYSAEEQSKYGVVGIELFPRNE